jgi:dihydrofolate synthase/folylpolyglutamate synthase
MDYQATLDYLYSQLPMFHRIGKAAYKANLDNTIALDEYFGHPHRKFKTIHIAGTNGKGSISHILASILQKAGYKTGLYTSPHLKDFRERIKINGKEIQQQKIVEFVEKHKAFFEPIQPSFFELTVAIAFDFFAKEKVDVAVVETGLGGRLDSTNIILPKLSIITNISNDHSQFLGDTLEKIAGEKAGIIKRSVPVVIGESQKATDHVFIKKASEMDSSIYFANQKYRVGDEIVRHDQMQIFQVFQGNQICFPELKLDLNGLYQKKNAVTVFQSIEILRQKGFKIHKNDIYQGFENAAQSTGLYGRWQTLGHNPLIICDTGHNEAGIAEILEQIKTITFNKLHFVFGVVEDKDIDRILEMLPVNAIYYFCRASIPRALDEKILRKKAALFGLEGQSYASVKLALHSAKENAQNKDFIFIGGSTFVVAEVC